MLSLSYHYFKNNKIFPYMIYFTTKYYFTCEILSQQLKLKNKIQEILAEIGGAH